MEKILATWNLKTIQEFVNISLHLKDNGKTLEDVIEYLKNPIVENKVTKVPKAIHIVKKCEQKDCSGMMELFTVCCSDVEKKKEGYFTKWECKKCGFIEYDKRKLEEIRGLNA